jgi:hypothetical protein
MVKVWKDAGEVTKTFDIEGRLYTYEDMMKSIPNFDKSEVEEVYQREKTKGPKAKKRKNK